MTQSAAVTLPFDSLTVVERPLSPLTRLWNIPMLRRGVILAMLAVIWQIYAGLADNPLMFPSFSGTATAFWDAVTRGTLLAKSWTSVQVLLLGYAIGVSIAFVLAGIAASTRMGEDLLATLTAMFNPLPAIALLPLALLWFGLGTPSLLFVLVHAVLWPLALNASAGFSSVSETLRMAGRNYGLTGWRYIARILIPAAFPAILTGLKIGWAFAWRTLIAAELVFGVASGSGGLGWFIFENKNRLETDYVFAGLGTVIIIGLLVEGLIFRTIERHTIRKWGMQR
ncbi:ABC transporter permease [Paramagnetospirillum kuznetsovii]|uniref:ABC transporter permease n=1 Tax=Paramagnetospirillum kuznetsovii TaxID=2053833 RepID=A0A364NTW3_9PROT|nr:ABC transporter permease [Paramagnetospirillum kuznetsovii]RAU20539.1 ABC transporter permease [Paramagnetospirillum kuznetsovii]